MTQDLFANLVSFPAFLESLASAQGELRAGGTDLMERRRSGRSRGPMVDLRDVPGLDGIEAIDGGLRIGAKVTIAALAAHSGVPAGLAQAAGGLATPQIRAVATVGGNLAQHVRCWYYRNPQFSCLKTGGSGCPAREGDHLYHGCFDTGGCVAPHASTLACAFLAYDATVAAYDPDAFVGPQVRELAADLPAHHVYTHVHVPAPAPGEGAAYVRAIARARAEWALVEVVARVLVVGGVVTAARVAVGGVAERPLRREAVELALIGGPPSAARIAAAAAHATDGAKPLPMTAYKLPILVGAVQEALERAVGAS